MAKITRHLLSVRYKTASGGRDEGMWLFRNEPLLCPSPGGRPGSGEETRGIRGRKSDDDTASSVLVVLREWTYDVLSGADLLGQLAALHCAEVQVLVEEFSVQDVPHGVLQAAAVVVQHSGRKIQKGSLD